MNGAGSRRKGKLVEARMNVAEGRARRLASSAVSIAASAALALALVPVAAVSEAAAATVEVGGTSGTCDWEIDSDGVLTISPTDGESGTLDSVSSASDVPWRSYRKTITSVEVEEGVSGDYRMNYLFFGCTNLVSVDLSNLDMSGTTYAQYLFEGCSSLESISLEITGVKYLDYLFYGCTSLERASIEAASVGDVSYMFYGCISLEAVDLSSFDTSSVTSMSRMFYGCTSLEAVDLSSFDTSSVTSMSRMFDGCTSLEAVDLSSFDTLSVTSMDYMFYECSSLESLDGFELNTLSANSLSYLFYGCSSLKSLDFSSANTSKVYSYGGNSLFDGCTGLRTVVTGKGFSFSETDYLPLPYDDTYGYGVWRGSDGVVYEDPENMPDNTADTYTAIFDTSVTAADEEDESESSDDESSDVGGADESNESNDYSTWEPIVSTEEESSSAASSDSSSESSSSSAISLSSSSVSLSSTSFVYAGKAVKPSVTVKAGGAKLSQGSDYTLSYSGNKAIGTGKVTVTGCGGYKGSVTKSFSIMPAKAKVKKASAGKKKVSVKLAKTKGGVRYQIRYRVKGSKKWKTVTSEKTSKTIKKLKRGKRYQVQARAFKKVGGKKYVGAWSKAKTTKKVK